MATQPAYKLQEFVAHSSAVNCLKIGRKSSRVLITGGEDHKVNIWAIGKPNAIMSLSGHSSGIDSVSFDSSEVLIAAGAASGSIKLWDLEQAKIVRTFTGHRSNCISVDFHPFGELFASGSLDTDLKIWDIRKKGCIQTYKGHTRGVNTTRFTPDGRWIVSGGGDNTVKLWDLTAGKMLHDFKCHEGRVRCIDFHPHEFLLATGSSDRTVKFWDLETFELMGSAGTESSGVRCLTFNPDGRTLLCGLHESLKVFSWEPIICHETVDVGWSALSDLNVHEGKLLGCSYNQSCVGIWVVDILRIKPYAVHTHSNASSEVKSASGRNSLVPTESNVKVGIGRLSTVQNSDSFKKKRRALGRALIPENSLHVNNDSKAMTSTAGVIATTHRLSLSTGQKNTAISSALSRTLSQSRNAVSSQLTQNCTAYSKSDMVPAIVPRNDSRLEKAGEMRRENILGRAIPLSSQSKSSTFRRLSNTNKHTDGSTVTILPESRSFKPLDLGSITSKNILSSGRSLSIHLPASGHIQKDDSSIGLKRDNKSIQEPIDGHPQESWKTHSLAANLERKEKSPGYECPAMVIGNESQPTTNLIVQRYWKRNEIKTGIKALEKMGDHGVIADAVSLLIERFDVVTLEICTVLLPLLASLLESDIDRHLEVSLEMLIKLMRVFGSVIYSALSASTPIVGVDIEAEQRLERYSFCFAEFEKAKRYLPLLTRRGRMAEKLAQELSSE